MGNSAAVYMATARHTALLSCVAALRRHRCWSRHLARIFASNQHLVQPCCGESFKLRAYSVPWQLWASIMRFQ